MTWHVDEVSGNVHTIRFDVTGSGWKQLILLTGDRHHDSPHTNRQLEKIHLDTALELNAPVIDVGDWFDAMQGRDDPRRSRDDLTDDLLRDDYFDALVDQAEAFYTPYAHLLAVLAVGNHEMNVRKRAGTDLTNRFAHRMRRVSGQGWPYRGGYGGYVRLQFDRGTHQTSMLVKYFHGSGGGGPVTKGVIKTNRHAVIYPDADIVLMGHIHEAWAMPIAREKITKRGRIYKQNQWHVCIPSYKDEYGDGEAGWHVERGAPPKPIGCAWIELQYLNDEIVAIPRVDIV